MGSVMRIPVTPVAPQSTPATPADASAVVAFWAASSAHWFDKDAGFDHAFSERFLGLHMDVAARKHDGWMASSDGALALLILTDQFPRNMFRDDPRAFATDALARHIADGAIAAGFDRQIEPPARQFFYMPFEHSEELADQDLSVALFEAHDDEMYLDYAIRHREVVAEYGRFPHRNAFLGRVSTREEEAYLAEPGAGF